MNRPLDWVIFTTLTLLLCSAMVVVGGYVLVTNVGHGDFNTAEGGFVLALLGLIGLVLARPRTAHQ